jgi:hypothetical protein
MNVSDHRLQVTSTLTDYFLSSSGLLLICFLCVAFAVDDVRSIEQKHFISLLNSRVR